MNEDDWISDNERPTLKNKTDEQKMQMFKTKLLKSIIPIERNDKSLSDNITNTDKICIKPCMDTHIFYFDTNKNIL